MYYYYFVFMFEELQYSHAKMRLAFVALLFLVSDQSVDTSKFSKL